MPKLYGKQQAIADEITEAITSDNVALGHTVFISGEMGVGKTYIASEIARELKDPEKLTLVISPAETTTKWKAVIEEFTKQEATIFAPKTKVVPTKGILILTDRQLTAALDGLIQAQSNMDLIIYDEIHKLKPGTKPYENITEIRTKETPFLALTGTIFSQNTDKLSTMLSWLYPNIPELANSTNEREFFMYYWTQVAWSISLADVQSDFTTDGADDILQDIAPIKMIKPTLEQLAVYNVSKHQLSSIKVPHPEATAASILDLPGQSLQKRRNLKTLGQPINYNAIRDFQLGFTLRDIEFTHTPKYQRAVEILKESDEKTIIFVSDQNLISKLKTTLTADGFKVSTLPASLKSHEYSEYINAEFTNNCDVFIVNPMRISTGVDITTASRIIWYQLLEDLGSTLQAQRRVYRLSSTKNSTVHYLAYEGTYQDDLIREISESAKSNALSYGQNDTSNLAKLTGLLFGDL